MNHFWLSRYFVLIFNNRFGVDVTPVLWTLKAAGWNLSSTCTLCKLQIFSLNFRILNQIFFNIFFRVISCSDGLGCTDRTLIESSVGLNRLEKQFCNLKKKWNFLLFIYFAHNHKQLTSGNFCLPFFDDEVHSRNADHVKVFRVYFFLIEVVQRNARLRDCFKKALTKTRNAVKPFQVYF